MSPALKSNKQPEEDFLPFSKPPLQEEAIQEVVDCLRSGWITTGPRVGKFEESLKAYFQSNYALCVNSGTSGLHLALLAAGVGPGDEVITTPLTFIATLNTIAMVGAKPVLADIDPHTYNIDPARVAEKITSKTKAIMPVHLTGLPADLDPLYAHGLTVIEDAAQAIGTEYKGKKIGSFGDLQVFSFQANKTMTTAEGGCITTQNPGFAKDMSIRRFHGIDRAAWDRFGKKGTQHYEVVSLGYKYNMMDIQAALGLHQLKDLESFIARRTALANRYLEAFSDWPELTLPKAPFYAHRHSWYIFAPLINPKEAGMDRDRFMEEMKSQNIGTGLHYRAAHLYPYYADLLGHREGDLPKAENVCSRIVSLPLFPDMTEADQDRVIETMARIFKKA